MRVRAVHSAVEKPRRPSSRPVDVSSMRNREDRDGARLIVDAVHDPVRPTTSGPVALQLETQRLAEATRIQCDRAEGLDDGGGNRDRQAVKLATCWRRQLHVPWLLAHA